MPTSTAFKDLCLDAVDPAVAAAFWGPVLGLRARSAGGPDLLLHDGVDEHRLWINRVPEPRTVKQRVHLDVHVAAVADLVALGATVLDVSPRWTVLADPEGGELCAFVRPPEDLRPYRLYEVVVDAADPEAIARWWAGVFGGTAEDDSTEEFSWVEGIPGLPGESLVFQRVPEPKVVKNRIHWDLWGDRDTLVAAGAQVLRPRADGRAWDVLADPEGNEFCVFGPGEAG